ncbi:MAG: FG-GAP repeat domain-containing protein [Lysobacterales bacterium]
MVAADVTGDGIVDLISLNQAAQDVAVLAGNGSGGFAAAVSYLPGRKRARLPTSMAIAARIWSPRTSTTTPSRCWPTRAAPT